MASNYEQNSKEERAALIVKTKLKYKILRHKLESRYEDEDTKIEQELELMENATIQELKASLQDFTSVHKVDFEIRKVNRDSPQDNQAEEWRAAMKKYKQELKAVQARLEALENLVKGKGRMHAENA